MLLLAPVLAGAAETAWVTHEEIRAAATKAVRDSIARSQGRAGSVSVKVDRRLRLRACASPLEAELPYQQRPGQRRQTVRISCRGPAPWRIHVPVEVTRMQNVVVARRMLPRGHAITRSDIEVVERTSADLGRGFVSDPDAVVGMRLRRALVPGAVVNPGGLAAETVVARGQPVAMRARSGGIEVMMKGTALESGARGALIGIRNASSGRTVRAVVVSRGVVEVVIE